LLITFNLWVAALNQQFIQYILITLIIIFIAKVSSIHRAVDRSFGVFIISPHDEAAIVIIHRGQLDLVQGRPQMHGHLELIIAVVALLGDLGLVLVLHLRDLHIRPLQRLVQLFIQLEQVLLLGLLLPELLVQRHAVLLQLLYPYSQVLHGVFQFGGIGIPVLKLLHLLQPLEI
jgi:hypothetical protein